MKLLSAHNNKRFFNKHGFKLAMLLALLFVLSIILLTSLKAREQYLVQQENYQPQKIKQSNLSGKETYRVSDITSANLFGSPEKRGATTSQKAPKTKLDLTLQGILFTRDQNLARAIIVSGKKRSQLYSIGDTIKGSSVEVKEIRNEEVIINRNGLLESLPLIKKTDSGNNEIFVFSSPEELYSPNINNPSNNNPAVIKKSQPRKIRRPNFSGLDRKLKKMGEL